MQVPAVAYAGSREQRRETSPETMRPGRGVDRLASQQLPIRGGDRIGCFDAELHLSRSVLSV